VRSEQHSGGERPTRIGGLPRRTTDRVEDAAAWLLCTLGLLSLLGALIAGVRVHSVETEHGRIESAERSLVQGVLLESVPYDLSGGETGPQAPVAVATRYVDLQGVAHVAPVEVRGPMEAGTSVPVWVDRSDRVCPAPAGPYRALVTGVVVAVTVVALAGSILILGWLALRSVLGQANAVAWGREWERREPEWTGRTVRRPRADGDAGWEA
jgi:hypothetical protein